MKIPLCLIAAMAFIGLLGPLDSLAAPEAPVTTAPELRRPRILGISHVALLMHDVEKSRAFYKDYLGFDDPFSLPQRDGTGLYLTWIKVNDLQSIELFTEKDDSPDRLHQISFYTDDAEGLRRYVASKGIKVSEKTSLGRAGNLNFMLKDPDGHTIEIVEYLPTSWSSRDTGKHMPDTRISTHLRHFGFMVSDLAASRKFYGDILGFTETWRGSSDGKTLNWVNMKLPESDDYIEFMLYGEKPSVDRMRTLNHLSLEVPDVAKAEQVLKARTLPPGCRATTELKAGINRKRQINTFDADGTRVEIMEPNTVDGKVTPSSNAPPPTHP